MRSIITAIVLLIVSQFTHAGIIGIELVNNGNAETGDMSGWLTSGVEIIDIDLDPITPGKLGLVDGSILGNYSFTGALGNTLENMSQEIDLTGLQFEQGNEFNFEFSMLTQSRLSENGLFIDRALTSLTFLGSDLSIIDTWFFSDPDVVRGEWTWQSIFYSDLIPNNAATARISIDISRSGGFSNDAFVDNISFKILPTQALPVAEPASFGFLILYIFSLLYFKKKSKKQAVSAFRLVPLLTLFTFSVGANASEVPNIEQSSTFYNAIDTTSIQLSTESFDIDLKFLTYSDYPISSGTSYARKHAKSNKTLFSEAHKNSEELVRLLLEFKLKQQYLDREIFLEHLHFLNNASYYESGDQEQALTFIMMDYFGPLLFKIAREMDAQLIIKPKTSPCFKPKKYQLYPSCFKNKSDELATYELLLPEFLSLVEQLSSNELFKNNVVIVGPGKLGDYEFNGGVIPIYIEPENVDSYRQANPFLGFFSNHYKNIFPALKIEQEEARQFLKNHSPRSKLLFAYQSTPTLSADPEMPDIIPTQKYTLNFDQIAALDIYLAE